MAELKIISGGQTGVDRAALDAAIAQGLPYGGWCPRGGWAEDLPQPPGLLAKYPLLKETPLAEPAQRTEWNVRDSDAVLIIIDTEVAASKGTALALKLAERYRRPLIVVDLRDANALQQVRSWLSNLDREHGDTVKLGIDGPRESEAPGIYKRAQTFLHALFAPIVPPGRLESR